MRNVRVAGARPPRRHPIAAAAHRGRRCGVAFALLLVTACEAGVAPSGGADVEVRATVLLAEVSRIGVNLGAQHSWGAEQLSANVLQNPGFEGLLQRQVVFVRSATAEGFSSSENSPWLLWPEGFWAGAAFEVRSGVSAGTRGTLLRSHRAGPDGYPAYEAQPPLPPLQPGDAVALTQVSDGGRPGRWVAGDPVTAVLGDVRPGSPGNRSVALAGSAQKPADLIYYLDSIGEPAGKLLPVNGPWRLSFWSRADDGGGDLEVSFGRQGSAAFVDRSVSPGPQWAETVVDFDATDGGPVGTLELRFRAKGPGRVLLDDAWLGARGEQGGGFRAEVVQALRLLRPGHVRDWEGQQGSTLANRLAPAAGRRMSVSSPNADSASFEFSLGEVLDLCRELGASPWIVAPTAFGDDEWLGLGRFLAQRAPVDGFAEVVVEFGNENWNPLSRPAGIPDPATCGSAATRAFERLRQGAGPGVPLRAATNAQFANPAAALAFARSAPTADLLAVAPYFLFSLAAGLSPTQRAAALFPDDRAAFRALADGLSGGTQGLAVYEVNLHTTGGNAPQSERDAVTAGAASGTALARRLLRAQAAGARRQSAYVLAGYDMWTDDHSGVVKLWGLTRDVAGPPRLRPTGLAVAMLNQAIAGDLHVTEVAASAGDVTAAAYRSAAGWALALASARAEAVTLDVRFPPDVSAAVPARLLTLTSASPWDTNEEVEKVRIVESVLQARDGTLSVPVPAFGLVVLTPGESAS